MKKRILNRILAIALMSALLVGNMLPAFAQGGSNQDQASDAMLLARYPLVDSLEDISGNGKDAYGGANYSFQNGLVLRGDRGLVNGSYVKIPGDIFAGQENLTISVWVKSDMAKDNTSLISFGTAPPANSTTPQNYWILNPTSPNGKVKAAITKYGYSGNPWENEVSIITTNTESKRNVWTHYAAVLTENTMELFLNGDKIGIVQKDTKISDWGTQLDAYIGHSNYTADKTLDGVIQDVRVYGESFTRSDIREIYTDTDTVTDEIKDFLIEDAASSIHSTLGGLDNVLSDIDLPVEGKNNTTIEWSSNKKDIISDSGAVMLTGQSETVVLTATVSGEGKTVQKNITVKTVAVEDKKAHLDNVINNIDFPNAGTELDNKIRENINMPEEIDGVKLTWASSRQDVICTTVKENSDYFDVPAGAVTRPAEDTEVTLTVKGEFQGQTAERQIKVTVKEAYEEEYVAYLYAHFREFHPNPGDQDVFFGVSKNGMDWTALNNNEAILKSQFDPHYAVRDPYIIRSHEGDKFYLIGNNCDIYYYKNSNGDIDWGRMEREGSNSLVIWESTDLVNWTNHRLLPIGKGVGELQGNTWAPEATYDEKTGEYLVFWSRAIALTGYTEHIYVSKTRDFYNFTEPELYSNAEEYSLDASILKEGDTYYRAIKQGDMSVRLESSDKLLAYEDEEVLVYWGDTTIVDRSPVFTTIPNDAPGAMETYKGIYEGPTMYKFLDHTENAGKWCVMIDEYGSNGRGYIPFITHDLNEPNSIRMAEDNTYIMQEGAKHGTVIPITQKEYDALIEAYGVAPQYGNEETQIGPVLAYDFEETENGTVQDKAGRSEPAVGQTADAELKGKATYIYDEETQSNVLYLNGVKADASYVELPQGFFDGMDEMTISFDVKAETADLNHYDIAIGQGTQKYMYLRLRDNQIQGSITSYGVDKERKANEGTKAYQNKWINVKLVMDDHKMLIYVDGELAASNEHVRSISELDADLIAYIGKSFHSSDAYFKGSMDNFQVYNRALTKEEIAGGTDDAMAILKEKVEAATAIKANIDKYTKESQDQFLDALALAEGVTAAVSDFDVIQNAFDSLHAAIKGLAELKDDSKAILAELIEKAEGLSEDDYTPQSWAMMIEALDYAREVYKTENASQQHIDHAVNMLSLSMNILQPVANKTMLKAVLDEAEAAIDSGEVARAIPEVQITFYEAYNHAVEVFEDQDASYKEILEATIQLFEQLWNLGFTQVDKAYLADLVAMCDTIQLGNYKNGIEKETFIDALTEAKRVLEAADVNQEDIEKAYGDLLRASLNLIKKDTDSKALLQDAIEIAEEIKKNLDAYVEAGKDVFLSALDDAIDTYYNDLADEDEITAATESLLQALTVLRYKADKTALSSLAAKAQRIDLSAYPRQAAAIYLSVLETVQEILNDESLSEDDQAIVDEMTAILSEAIDTLMASINGSENPDDTGNKEDTSEESESASGESESNKEAVAGKNSKNTGKNAKNNVKTGDVSSILLTVLIFMTSSMIILLVKYDGKKLNK